MKFKFGICLILLSTGALAQPVDRDTVAVRQHVKSPFVFPPVKLSLNREGTNYLQLTALIQAQMRYNESNPGSTVNGTPNQNTWDVGLRRVRFQLLAQLSDRVFMYAQVGENSTDFLTSRKGGFFIHDALGEYAFIPRHLSLGMGLSSWVGPLRFSSPAVGSPMGMDAPLYQQTTNDLNDQFVRRFGMYAKGKVGKLDYRISIAKPYIVIAGASNQAAVLSISDPKLGLSQSTFAETDPSPQLNSYLSYQFLDQENNLTPYNTGTYGGGKKIFNVGGGIQFQSNAMVYKELRANGSDTAIVSTDLLTAGVDLFYDAPLDETGRAISFYAAYLYSDYGPNYTRQLGVMNPADARNSSPGALLSSGGSAFPMNGSGNTVSAQLGYTFRNEWLGTYGTLMPYAMFQASQFYSFQRPMLMYHLGVNWLLNGQHAKISLDYQDRPYFSIVDGRIDQTARRGMLVLQYQVQF